MFYYGSLPLGLSASPDMSLAQACHWALPVLGGDQGPGSAVGCEQLGQLAVCSPKLIRYPIRLRDLYLLAECARYRAVPGTGVLTLK